MKPPMRSWTVATFYHPYESEQLRDRAPTKSRINAYTRVYNPSWDGCIVYTVEDENGETAKSLARDMRLQHERAKYGAPAKADVSKPEVAKP